MRYFHPPLDYLFMVQPYGVNHVRKGYYLASYNNIKFRDKHKGWDLRARTPKPVYAHADGIVVYAGYSAIGGRFVTVRSREGDEGAQVYNGHLSKMLVKKGDRVTRGQLIALTGRSGGKSTGPHLHHGTYPLYWMANGSGPYRTYKDNGANGAVDPSQFYDPKLFAWKNEFAIAVDNLYGLKESERGYSDIEWYKHAAWVLLRTGRLPTTRQKKALIWGRWGLREIRDETMYSTWTTMSKPEYLSNLK